MNEATTAPSGRTLPGEHTLGAKTGPAWRALAPMAGLVRVVGGTAIALRCAHREPADLDLAVIDAKRERDAERQLAECLELEGMAVKRNGARWPCTTWAETRTRPQIDLAPAGGWHYDPGTTGANSVEIAAAEDLLAIKWLAMRLRERWKDPGDCEALLASGADVARAASRFHAHARRGDRNALGARIRNTARWQGWKRHGVLWDVLSELCPRP